MLFAELFARDLADNPAEGKEAGQVYEAQGPLTDWLEREVTTREKDLEGTHRGSQNAFYLRG